MTCSPPWMRIPAWIALLGMLALAPLARAAADPPAAVATDPKDATVLIRVASSLRRGRGSGFVVGDGGWVVTAAHVVAADFGEGRMASEGALLVLSPWTGHWYEAQVRAIDPEADLALLRLEVTGLPALPLADMDQRNAAALAARWKTPELRLTGFPAELGEEARADQVAAEVCPTRLVDMGHRGEATVCFLQPGKVRPGWSGGPVTRADTGAVIAVFHSVYRPKKEPDLAFPCASALFQLAPLLKSAGADPSTFAH